MPDSINGIYYYFGLMVLYDKTLQTVISVMYFNTEELGFQTIL